MSDFRLYEGVNSAIYPMIIHFIRECESFQITFGDSQSDAI
jgi:hypothetical protein